MTNTLSHLPPLSLVTAGVGNLYKAISDEQASNLLQTAWDNNIRFFDTAPHYGAGLSEQRLGQFLRHKQSTDYTLSTKVGRLLKPISKHDTPDDEIFVDALPNYRIFDYSYDGIMQSIDDSLQRLQCNYIDIAYVHDIGSLTHGDANAKHMDDLLKGGGIKALQSLKQQSVIGAYGIGVNEKEICIDLLQQIDLDYILLAGRYTLLEQHCVTDLLPLCKQCNTNIIIGGVFNSGMLATPKGGNLMYNYAPAPEHMVAHMNNLHAVCEQYGVDLPAVALQFVSHHPAVKSVLLGTSNINNLLDCITWQQQPIPPQLWQDLRNKKLLHPDAPIPLP